MKISEIAKGEIAILGKSLMGGLFPVITVLSYASLSPLVSLFFTLVVATVFFASVVTIKQNWAEVFNPRARTDFIMIALLIGVLYYSLYFWGLKYTSPGNASLIGLLEVCVSFLFFNVWRGEKFSRQHILGAALMTLGGVIILSAGFGWHSFNRGDLLVLAAITIAPFGNYFQKRARGKVSSETIMLARSFLSIPGIFILILIFGEKISLTKASEVFWILAINGIFLLGVSKVLWLEGIHRIAVAKANALGSLVPVFTLVFSYLLLQQSPTPFQLIALIPLGSGLVLLTWKTREASVSG